MRYIVLMVLALGGMVNASGIFGGGSSGGGFGLYVAASDSSSKDKAAADYKCDGTADNEQIQAAIDAVAIGGGTVYLAAGAYTLASSITLKSGVIVEGSGVKTSATVFWDGTATVIGGTIIKGAVTCFIGNEVYTSGIKNLAFKDVTKVCMFGAENEYGVGNFVFSDIVIEDPTDTAVYFCNSQHIYSERVKMLGINKTGLHFVSDNATGFQPGNSIFTDLYLQRNISNDTLTGIKGILIENATGDTGGVCYLTFIKCQFNMWIAKTNTVTVDTGTDVFSASSSLQFADGGKVRVRSTGTGLVLANNLFREDISYYVYSVSGDTCKLYPTQTINFTPGNAPDAGDTTTIRATDTLGSFSSITVTGVTSAKDLVEALKTAADAAKTAVTFPWNTITASENDTALTLLTDITKPSVVYTITPGDGETLPQAIASTALNIVSSNGVLSFQWADGGRYHIYYSSPATTLFIGHKLIGLDLEGDAENCLYAEYLYNSAIQFNGVSDADDSKYAAYLASSCHYVDVELSPSKGRVYTEGGPATTWTAYKGIRYVSFGGDAIASSVAYNFLGATVEMTNASLATFTLPAVRYGMAGQKITLRKASGAGAIKVVGEDATPTLTGYTMPYNTGAPYVNLTGMPTWQGEESPVPSKYTKYAVYLSNDAGINTGWYYSSSSNSSILSFAGQGTSIWADGSGASGSQTPDVLIRTPIIDGATILGEYTEMDAVGDRATFECDGVRGWIVTDEFITP